MFKHVQYVRRQSHELLLDRHSTALSRRQAHRAYRFRSPVILKFPEWTFECHCSRRQSNFVGGPNILPIY
jgi:hypothetical protein